MWNTLVVSKSNRCLTVAESIAVIRNSFCTAFSLCFLFYNSILPKSLPYIMKPITCISTLTVSCISKQTWTYAKVYTNVTDESLKIGMLFFKTSLIASTYAYHPNILTSQCEEVNSHQPAVHVEQALHRGYHSSKHLNWTFLMIEKTTLSQSEILCIKSPADCWLHPFTWNWPFLKLTITRLYEILNWRFWSFSRILHLL